MFVRNKSIIKTILTSNCPAASIGIAFSSENVTSSESGEKYAHIKHCLQAKTVLNYIFFWEDNRDTG